jgi:uncharacterized protein with HEPN domain
MRHEPAKYVHDMLSSCEFLSEFTKSRTMADYEKDRGFRSAVERELEIIGEALLQLDKLAPDVAERVTEKQKIIGFRHVLVHGYSTLKPIVVWNVVTEKLPSLKAELDTILAEIGSGLDSFGRGGPS